MNGSEYCGGLLLFVMNVVTLIDATWFTADSPPRSKHTILVSHYYDAPQHLHCRSNFVMS